MGTQLAITVMDTRYDKECLAVVANKAFSIRFDNEDRCTARSWSVPSRMIVSG
jgi:hypothetical protein